MIRIVFLLYLGLGLTLYIPRVIDNCSFITHSIKVVIQNSIKIFV